MKYISMLFEYFFGQHTFSALFSPPNQSDFSSVPGRGFLTISTRLVFGLGITERLKFSSIKLETSQPGNELQIIFFVTSNRENLWILDNVCVSKINVISSDILSSIFQNSFFQRARETSNFPLSSNTS